MAVLYYIHIDKIEILSMEGNEMQTKEYKIFRSPAKTAKENNLILAEGISNKMKRLFDFSLLDGTEIAEEEKEAIKEWALKDISGGYLESYYAKNFNRFHACEGRAAYTIQRIYSMDGKRLYNIFRLDFIKHNKISRKSVYDDFAITTYQYRGENTILQDVEIA
jgi:hypothetical protein